MSTTVSIRLPKDIAELLDRIATETERSRSFHVQKAVKIYLKQFADAQIAIDRLGDPRDPVISSEEMKRILGL